MADATNTTDTNDGLSGIHKMVPYTFYSSDEMVDMLVEDMLYKFYKEARSDAMRERMLKAYHSFTGIDMLTTNMSAERSAPYALNGLAGNGKTSVIEAAARIVAKHAGMQVLTTREVTKLIAKDAGWVPSENHLILHTKSMGGMMSAQDLYGTPLAQDRILSNGVKKTSIRNVPEEVVDMMQYAGASVMILDDFWNCSEMVQNAAFQVIDRGQLDTTDLGCCYIPITGNLGSGIDGANVNPPSTPMATRVKMAYVEDRPEDWCNRIVSEFNDARGDGYVSAFIRSSGISERVFNIPASDDRLSQFEIRPSTSNPRTWHALVTEMRRYLHERDMRKEPVSTTEIKKIATTCVGPIAGEKYSAFAYRMLSGVDIVARNLMDTGQLDAKKFQELYGDGLSAGERDRGHQFAASFANHAARYIIQGNGDSTKVAEGMRRYAHGALLLDPSTLQLSINFLAERLLGVGSLSEEKKRASNFKANGQADRTLTQPAMEMIVAEMSKEGSKLGLWTADMAKTVTENLSGTSKWRTAPVAVLPPSARR